MLVIFLRLSGKRTLSKMNAFDLVVTVALGSTLATVLLTKDVALADGALAFARAADRVRIHAADLIPPTLARPVTRKPYPTSTRTSDGRLVPWLAAEGSLAYTPAES